MLVVSSMQKSIFFNINQGMQLCLCWEASTSKSLNTEKVDSSALPYLQAHSTRDGGICKHVQPETEVSLDLGQWL